MTVVKKLYLTAKKMGCDFEIEHYPETASCSGTHYLTVHNISTPEEWITLNEVVAEDPFFIEWGHALTGVQYENDLPSGEVMMICLCKNW